MDINSKGPPLGYYLMFRWGGMFVDGVECLQHMINICKCNGMFTDSRMFTDTKCSLSVLMLCSQIWNVCGYNGMFIETVDCA